VRKKLQLFVSNDKYLNLIVSMISLEENTTSRELSRKRTDF